MTVAFTVLMAVMVAAAAVALWRDHQQERRQTADRHRAARLAAAGTLYTLSRGGGGRGR